VPGEIEFVDEGGGPAAPDPAGADVLDSGVGRSSMRARLLAWALAAAVVLAGGAAWLGDRGEPSGAAADAMPTWTAGPSGARVGPSPVVTVVVDPREGAVVWPNTIPAPTPTPTPTPTAERVEAVRARSVSCVAHYLRRLVGMAEAYQQARAQGKVHTAAERAAAARLAEHVRKGSKRYYAVWRAWAQNWAPLVEHSGPVVMTEQCG
jgi:hypothetical protein